MEDSTCPLPRGVLAQPPHSRADLEDGHLLTPHQSSERNPTWCTPSVTALKEQAFLQLLEELGIPPAVDWGTVDSKLQQQCVEDMRYIAVSAKSRNDLYKQYTECQLQLESRLADLEPETWQQVQRQLAGSSEDAPLLSLGIHSSELVELPACIGRLGTLQTLDLSGCTSLQRLPSSICQLSSLQVLSLSSCEWLERLPSSLGDLSSLQMLDLSSCISLERLPSSIGRLSSLQVLSLSGCSWLERLPSSLGDLSSLQMLDLSGCTLLLPSDEQLRSLQRPAEARLAAQQLWAAIRSEQKQQSIMEAGGADRLVGVLASEDAGDPLRASICSIVRVLACNLTYCSRLAAAGAGPVLLRLFCRDDFCSDGLAQQRAAPGRALLQMSAFKTVATSLVQAGGIKQLKQCIDSIVTSGRWKNVGTKQLQIAGELVACLLNKQAPPHSREHLKLASLAVDKVASIQYGMQAAGGQDVLDAFVDVELTVALTAYGKDDKPSASASQPSAAQAGNTGTGIISHRISGLLEDVEDDAFAAIATKSAKISGKPAHFIGVKNATKQPFWVTATRLDPKRRLTDFTFNLDLRGAVGVALGYQLMAAFSPQEGFVDAGDTQYFYLDGDNDGGTVEAGRRRNNVELRRWVQSGRVWIVRANMFPHDTPLGIKAVVASAVVAGASALFLGICQLLGRPQRMRETRSP